MLLTTAQCTNPTSVDGISTGVVYAACSNGGSLGGSVLSIVDGGTPSVMLTTAQYAYAFAVHGTSMGVLSTQHATTEALLAAVCYRSSTAVLPA